MNVSLLASKFIKKKKKNEEKKIPIPFFLGVK